VKKDAAETRQLNQQRYLAKLTSPVKTDFNSNQLRREDSKHFLLSEILYLQFFPLESRFNAQLSGG
jgi:hypothetical protein